MNVQMGVSAQNKKIADIFDNKYQHLIHTSPH